MTNHTRKILADSNTTKWPEPLKYEYHDDFSEEKMKKIKESADAPADSDDNWKVVDGPGW